MFCFAADNDSTVAGGASVCGCVGAESKEARRVLKKVQGPWSTLSLIPGTGQGRMGWRPLEGVGVAVSVSVSVFLGCLGVSGSLVHFAIWAVACKRAGERTGRQCDVPLMWGYKYIFAGLGWNGDMV